MSPLFIIMTERCVQFVLSFAVFAHGRKDRIAKAELDVWARRRCRIPALNWYLKRKSGNASGALERWGNRLLISGTRAIVNTETFEHLVNACVNRNSTIKIKRPGSRPAKQSKFGFGTRRTSALF